MSSYSPKCVETRFLITKQLRMHLKKELNYRIYIFTIANKYENEAPMESNYIYIY